MIGKSQLSVDNVAVELRGYRFIDDVLFAFERHSSIEGARAVNHVLLRALRILETFEICHPIHAQ
jgi:hypothetical protein